MHPGTRLLFCVLLAWLAMPGSAGASAPALAIVVDDLGYGREQGERVIALPGPLAVGVLPFAPNAAALAELAAASGKEVILHQPMQAVSGVASSPGELTVGMSGEDLRARLAEALGRVPQAIGVNNHTGSLLTAQPVPMHTLMQEIRSRGLFFLDSRTTAATVAEAVALASGVPALRRDVFLDHVVHPQEIARQFERALGIARAQGHAVVIAHPHAASLQFLEAELPRLERRGIRQIALTQLFADRDRDRGERSAGFAERPGSAGSAGGQ